MISLAQDYKNVIPILKDLEKVTHMILSHYSGEVSIEIKEDNTPVTEVDLKSDAMIRDVFSKHTPDIPVISEEIEIPPYDVRSAYEYFWLVDPLDGTKEYINKTDEFAINIALIHKDTPIIGILVTPVYHNYYFGTYNSDVYCYNNGTIDAVELALHTSGNVLLSRAHKDDEAKELIKDIERDKCITFNHITLGSSHKQIAIITGKADLYAKLSPGPKEWDFAAGQLLIERTGGSIIDLSTGKKPVYNKRDMAMSGFVMKSAQFLANDNNK